MKKTITTMGMPATVQVLDESANPALFDEIFAGWQLIDERFSPYKSTSEVNQINAGQLSALNYSQQMIEIVRLAAEVKRQTAGYFDVWRQGRFDPSGIVKGYAIQQAASWLEAAGYRNFLVEIAGDIELRGQPSTSTGWRVGLENPFDRSQLIKIVELKDRGIATSGTYIRGPHIDNPISGGAAEELISLTVIAEDVFRADSLATAACAMGRAGLTFLAQVEGVEAYAVLPDRQAIFTSGFEQYVVETS